jgi:hypothetical protein
MIERFSGHNNFVVASVVIGSGRVFRIKKTDMLGVLLEIIVVFFAMVNTLAPLIAKRLEIRILR